MQTPAPPFCLAGAMIVDPDLCPLFCRHQGKLFVIENGQCEVRPLNGSMEAFCVPAGATKRGEATLGLSLNTAAWSFTEDDVAFELIVSTEVRCSSEVACVLNVDSRRHRLMVGNSFLPVGLRSRGPGCGQHPAYPGARRCRPLAQHVRGIPSCSL